MGDNYFIFPCDDHRVSDDWPTHRSRGSLGGVDYKAGYGSAVYAMADGVVTITDSSTSGSGGRYVRVTHADGSSTEYLHLSQILVSRGQRVAQGQVIARSGASGYGQEYYYGPHLHVHGIWPNGVRYDCTTRIGGGGGNATPSNPSNPSNPEEGIDMLVIAHTNRQPQSGETLPIPDGRPMGEQYPHVYLLDTAGFKGIHLVSEGVVKAWLDLGVKENYYAAELLANWQIVDQF